MVPPPIATVTQASESPLQGTLNPLKSESVADMFMGSGSVRVMVEVATHPFESVTVTVTGPANKPIAESATSPFDQE